MSQQKKIWMVDDHVLIRHSLKELIERFGPYVVTKQFDGGPEFLNEVNSHTALPHLIILDISMPGMSGEEVMKNLHQLKLELPILILTLNEDESQIVRLFRLGVKGYLKKNCSAKELETALFEITEKGYFHNEFLTLSIRNNSDGVEKTSQETIFNLLTGKEKQFLALVCNENEYTYEKIADIMNVTLRTVDGYRQAIFDKFGIKSKTGLVLFVLKNRLYDTLINYSPNNYK